MATLNPDEIIAQPLAALDTLFEEHLATASTPAAQWGERAHFVRALGLDDEQNYSKIPCLNDMAIAEMAKPFSLVRYRGMVQDVFEPEIFSACVEEHDENNSAEPGLPKLRSTKYRECLQPTAPGRVFRHPGRDMLSQRGVCYLVPVPGETSWAQEALAKSGPETQAVPAIPSTGASRKRGVRDEDVDMGAVCASDQIATEKSGSDSGAAVPVSDPRSVQPDGKAPVNASAGQRGKTADEFGLNLPLPLEEKRGAGSSTVCIVKFYDEHEEAMRLCETVEVLGVLCVNPEIANLGPPIGEGFDADARQPSTALVPRLHAIAIRKMPFFHPIFPFTSEWLTEARLNAAYHANLSAPGALATARSAAVEQLSRVLGGDGLSAEYVLMQLVSRSFSKLGDKALGVWSLNLARWPKNTEVAPFAQAVSELVPKAVHLQVTTKSLNQDSWKPVKDYIANRLVAGRLQLAAGTALILDETELAEGQVTGTGVKAVSAISNLVTQQELTCDFSAYDVRVPLELMCMIVSHGKSIIQGVETVIPVKPAEVKPDTAIPLPLDAARFLIGLLTRSPKPLTIPDDVTTKISEDFSELRAQLQVPPELCHTWMGMARAMCLTHGENELKMERWQAIMQFERERLGRCKVAGLLN